MFPRPVSLFGLETSIWNLTFLFAVVVTYPLFLRALRARLRRPLPGLLPLRWIAIVYLSALAAQLFSYAFDLHTTILPPPDIHWARYYLDPFFGAKTLYGVVMLLPLSIIAVSLPWRDLGYGEALDAWTPPLFAVLGICRIGCFLQGCCYGVPSRTFGIAFPPAGPSYQHQVSGNLIAPGDPPLPLVPAQLLESAALFALCVFALGRLERGRTSVFAPSIVLYSLARFAIEFVRDDPERNALGPLATSQWIALAVVAAYAAAVAFAYAPAKRAVRA